MTVFVERRGVSAETLFRRYGRTAFIVDVTSYSSDPQWRRFSPFYVHAGPVPIPYSPEGWVSRTVEGCGKV